MTKITKTAKLITVLLWIPITWGSAAAMAAPATPVSTAACQAAPLVIAHRGASGYLPEHSLEAYRQAIAQGADIIEVDLVPSQDAVLMTRHENELSNSTDVAKHPEFANRQTRKMVDGVWQQGWFSEDFTLQELRTLKLKETLPALRKESAQYDGQFQIATFAEVLQLLARENQQRSLQVGRKAVDIYIETKHPTYFAQAGRTLSNQPIGLDITALLVEALLKYQSLLPDTVYIQSFEMSNLLQLRAALLPALPKPLQQKIKLIQLLGDTKQQYMQPKDSFSEPFDLVYLQQTAATPSPALAELAKKLPAVLKPGFHYGQLLNTAALPLLAGYADGIGPWRQSLYPWIGADLTLLRQAQSAGLQVHPYTFRQEDVYLLKDKAGQTVSMHDELTWLFQQGIDGVFADFPDVAIKARSLACQAKG